MQKTTNTTTIKLLIIFVSLPSLPSHSRLIPLYSYHSSCLEMHCVCVGPIRKGQQQREWNSNKSLARSEHVWQSVVDIESCAVVRRSFENSPKNFYSFSKFVNKNKKIAALNLTSRSSSKNIAPGEGGIVLIFESLSTSIVCMIKIVSVRVSSAGSGWTFNIKPRAVIVNRGWMKRGKKNHFGKPSLQIKV